MPCLLNLSLTPKTLFPSLALVATFLYLSQNLNFVTEKSMSLLLAKLLSMFRLLLACRPKILLFLH